MALLGGRFSGTVKSFKGQWGFVTAEGVDGDVFIHVKHSPALANATLRVGETVDFELSSGGPNNQARAVNATSVDGAENYGSAPLNGVIKSFRRGWGLIDSPSVEGSLYFGERDNPHCKEGSLLPGDEVTFELATNPNDGRNKGVNVHLAVKDQSECLGHRIRGNVKTFQDGWGFASSPRFQGTVLLGRKQVSAAGVGLQVGDTVEFEVSLAPNGKHEATNISKVFAGMGAAPPFGAAAAPHLALGNGGAYVATARNRSRSPYGMSQVPQAQGQYVGTVKTFRDGWGFLVSDQVEGDIYVKMRDSPYLGNPLQQGEAVSFDLVYRNESSGKNNGATATNVQRMGAGGGMARPTTVPPPPAWPPALGGGGGRQAAPAAGAVSSQHMGTVAQFKPPPDSWGWLESPTCQGQVFFGLRDNPQLQKVPEVGDKLVFELGAGPKGRSKAINISPSLVGQRVMGTMRNLYEGWGFATTDSIPGKVMVGKKALTSSGLDISLFQAGDNIEFEVSMALKGYEAVNIKKL
mmetsp:Transcript_19966/g.56316  ORF Transcript_19966/g.56316 Transcript_19966/m.56316 type:complete len:521 (-) Transcript_19966:135-1697(-)